MADILEAAHAGDRKAMYQGVLEDLVQTLEDGCAAYVKPGIVKQIVAVQKEIDALPEEHPDSPLAIARRRTAEREDYYKSQRENEARESA